MSKTLPDISRPQFPLSLLEVSRIVTDVEAPGGASVNFQSRVSTISLNYCSTSGGISLRGPIEEEEEEEEEGGEGRGEGEGGGEGGEGGGEEGGEEEENHKC
jgi:hypothetical protein